MTKILKICLSLLMVYSLTSCKTGNLTICISNPAKGGFECSKGGEAQYHLDYKDSENYIALPQDDARTVIDKCYKENP